MGDLPTGAYYAVHPASAYCATIMLDDLPAGAHYAVHPASAPARTMGDLPAGAYYAVTQTNGHLASANNAVAKMAGHPASASNTAVSSHSHWAVMFHLDTLDAQQLLATETSDGKGWQAAGKGPTPDRQHGSAGQSHQGRSS